jgi:predicted acetyltransferase
MGIEIRTVRPDELRGYADTISGAFLDRPDVDRMVEQFQDEIEFERTWAAFDGDLVCGSFLSTSTELTVPGGARLPGAAVEAVTVRPTHRRRGILTGMAATAHAAMRDAGDAVGLLYASEYPIYGRFGYGAACRAATWTLDASATGFHGAPGGRVELVAADPAAGDVMRSVYETWRVRRPGEILREQSYWSYAIGERQVAWGERWNGFIAVHRDEHAQIDGYARYRTTMKWEQRQSRSEAKVDDLHALNDTAYDALWRFLADIDLVTTVSAERRSPTERLPWLLTNQRAAVLSDVGDGMWVRLLDVPRALAARTYGTAGSLVIEVVDPELASPIRVVLDASPDGADCRATDRSPDVTLPITALGAAYLGGVPLGWATIATGVDEHRPGVLRSLETMLRTTDEPWCSTGF